MKYEPVLYRGIDFVIRTSKSAEVLTRELDQYIHFNRVWRRVRTIVLSSPRSSRGIEREILWFCRKVEKLSQKAAREWSQCSSRVIDVGVDSGNIRSGDRFVPLELEISPRTLERIARIKARLQVTVYPYAHGRAKSHSCG